MKIPTLNLLISAAAAALAGCAGAWNGADQALTIAEEHPITVDSQVVTLTIDADPAASELTAMDESRLKAFADAYLAGGHGALNVTTPAGGRNSSANALTADARNSLHEAGVDWADISGSSYIPAEGAPRRIILSYTRYVATPSACGVWEGMKARDYANLRSPNFGCATQNNLAAMIADPHDLVEPAGGGSSDAMARIRAIQKYREGEKTASETDNEIKTEVAEQ
jgi:pilus assembly protein CpaD